MNYDKQSYRSILRFAVNQGFEFVDFLTYNFSEDEKRKIILRHDIDYSLTLAHEMAEIDAEQQIKSTFALLLASPLYNPFTSTNIKIINEIHALGHNLVLHHHVTPGQPTEQIRDDIIKSMQVMRAFFPFFQNVFVWHDLPINDMLSNIEVPGMLNAYSTRFVGKIPYISDSVLRNKPEDFLIALRNNIHLHLLLHPLIWMSEKDNMVSMVSYVLTKIIRECDQEFLVNRAWKRKFSDGIPQEVLDRLQALLSS